MLLTSTGAVPVRVTTLVVELKSTPPLLVMAKLAATVFSWLTRKVRRWLNHVFTTVGATSAPPSHIVIPLATSAAYFASITGLQSSGRSGPSTAFFTARK